jgi:hypothetical protein
MGNDAKIVRWRIGRREMLSLHEIAALIVLANSDQDHELDPADVSALVVRKLVRLDMSTPGRQHMQVTSEGQRVANAFARPSGP